MFIKTLIITDIDSIDSRNDYSKCLVADGTHTSNATIKKWFNDATISPTVLIAKAKNEKIIRGKPKRKKIFISYVLLSGLVKVENLLYDLLRITKKLKEKI